MPKEVQKERREAAANATLSKKETERNTNAEKSRMKGKNRVSKRYRKKQQNVVDDKKMRANILKEEQKKGEEKKSIPAMRNTFEVGTGRQRKVRACCVFSDASVSSVFSIRLFLFSNRGMYFNQFVCSPPPPSS